MCTITMKSKKADMFAEIQRLNAVIAAQAKPAEVITHRAIPRTPMPQWQIDRANQMAAARAAAMQSGSVVKVG